MKWRLLLLTPATPTLLLNLAAPGLDLVAANRAPGVAEVASSSDHGLCRL